MSEHIHARTHSPQYFHRRDMMTQPFSSMPYLHWTRITLGPCVILDFTPTSGFYAAYLHKINKVCVSIKLTGQIPMIISTYHMKNNSQVGIFDMGSSVHNILGVQVV